MGLGDAERGAAARSWRRRIGRSATLALALLPAGCGDDAPARRPNVLILTVDTLRADRLGCYGNRTTAEAVDPTGFPGWLPPALGSPSPLADWLAAEGVRFERCYVPRGQTHPSLASMLTGLHPITHGLRDNGQPLPAEFDSLATILRRAGYRTAAFPANLARERWDFWLRGFDVAEDGTDGRIVEEGAAEAFRSQRVWDRRVTDKAKAFLSALPDDDRPFLLWVHLYDVHDPYTPEPRDATPFTDPAYAGPAARPAGPPEHPMDRITHVIHAWTLGTAPMNDADVAHVKGLYDGGILGCERKLAEIVDALRATGREDDTLVVYSADHGDELADHHRYFAHGSSIYDGVLRVPLILRWPAAGGGGRVAGGLTQNLDVFPTVLEAAGLPVPEGCEGESLLPVLRGERATPARSLVFAEWEDLIYSVSDGAWKLIANPRGVRPRKPPYNVAPPGVGFPYECHELYHVAEDPHEQVNLFDRAHPEARRLNRALYDFLRDPRHLRPMRLLDPTHDASSLAGLDQLGYIGSTSGDRGIVTVDCGDER